MRIDGAQQPPQNSYQKDRGAATATNGAGRSMRKVLAIVTTTRDRRELLGCLLRSLERQTDSDFIWVVVDDASADSSVEWLEEVAATSSVKLRIIANRRQRGKCASLNRAFDEVDASFYLIVDSDDQLHASAVALVRNEVMKYTPVDKIGAILFSYTDTSGKSIGGPPHGRSVIATRAEFNARWGKYDGCVGYYRRVTSRYRYPEFEEEVYCGPTVLQLSMAPAFSMCFSPVVIGTAEYQPGGLTDKGRALRVANPRGMMEYTRLQEEQALTWSAAMLNRVMYYAYSHLSGSSLTARPTLPRVPASIAGSILAATWRRRYATPEARCS